MEITQTLRSDFAAMNVCRSQGSVYEILILTRWRQDIGLAAADLANLYLLILVISCDISRLQRVYLARCFEINMSDVAIVHLVENLGRCAFSWPRRMSLLGLGALDVGDVHYVSC